MRNRALILAAVLLGVLTLSWLLRVDEPPADSQPVATQTQRPFASRAAPSSASQTPSPAAPNATENAPSEPVDVAARAHFNEEARTFFAHASELSADERAREARELEQQLARLEHAGGLSAGETLLVLVGLIKATVSDPAQQDAQIKALQDRYKTDTQRRLAAAQARPDPQFESYKVRESEIVAEVMSMETIPDGLTRDEFLRRRLQSAREQLTPQ